MDRSQSPTSVSSAPYGHACANCARAKTRCIPRASGGCERCHRIEKHCTPSRTVRKRQSSTRTAPASKTARLEERLDDLVTLLASQSASKSQEAVPTAAAEVTAEPDHPWIPKSWSSSDKLPQQITSKRISKEIPRNWGSASTRPAQGEVVITPSKSTNSTPDSSAQISRVDELSPVEAGLVLHLFRSRYMRYTPFIYIPATQTAEDLQRERPYFWLVIRATCARSITEQEKLAIRARQVLADQVIVESERSIDLLLGALTYLAWSMYFARGKPYICALCGIVATLVFDLRLDKKASDDSSSLNCFKPYAFPKPPAFHPRSQTNEGRRAVLGFFYNTAIVSCYMKFEIARYKPNMEEILTFLWEAPETPSDRLLVAHTRVMIVVDDAIRLASKSEVTNTNTSIPAFHIRALLASLQQVKDGLPADILSDLLVKAHIYSAEIVINELAMSPTPSASPFKPAEYKRRESLLACLNASKAFLECFLTIKVEDYVGLPFWILLMFAHAVQVLYRLCLWDDPGWDRSMARQTADSIDYLQQTAAKMDQAHELGGYNADRTDDSLFAKAAGSLRMTMSVWSMNLEHMGAHRATQPGDDAAATRLNEALDPMLMDVGDDSWLTEMFASWEGH